MSVAVTASGSGAEEPFAPVGSGLRRGLGVSPQRQRAIVGILADLVPRAGRLSPARLRAVAARIAANDELWADLVVHDPDARWYLPLARSSTCDVRLLGWEQGRGPRSRSAGRAERRWRILSR
ncbi:MAG TPA: hypothetical protein VLW50_14925 [Streptosporangiaceae bacterium]|nr:hypothetical protein [Streptosporangiaceae bacterium]